MKTGESVRFKIFLIVVIVLTLILGCYSYRYNKIYNSITFEVSENRKIEFGTANYKVVNLLDRVSGNVEVLKDADTSEVGEQLVLLQVTKDNVSKNVPLVVEIIDSMAPEIEIYHDTVYVNSGKSFDVFSNIKSIVDNVDGNLEYKDIVEIDEKDKMYYTIIGDVDTNSVGTYEMQIKAVDSSFNEEIKSFKIIVTSHGKENTLRSVAYSLVGRPYVSGANGPSAFDCSGFVQYVYKRAGLIVGRSATDQYYNGYSINYSDIQIGDIIVWGYDSSHITHTAIYVGNGLMIHAANPNDGVIVNKVAGWGDYTNVHIVSVRRLP